MRRHSDDEERWAAALALARGRETATAATLLFGRTLRLLLVGIVGVALFVGFFWSPLADVVFPPRASAREPASWQLPWAAAGIVVGFVAYFWFRGVTNLAARTYGGSLLPLRDPRTVLTGAQRRAVDRRIVADGPVTAAQAPVVFDRALRYVTSSPPVAQWAQMPVILAALTATYRGPVPILVAIWLSWAGATAVSWRSGRRLRRAAEHWIATRGQVVTPVKDPTPGG